MLAWAMDSLWNVGFSLLTLARSEEHTSELQSQSNLVCRLLLEKKKKAKYRRSSQDNGRYGIQLVAGRGIAFLLHPIQYLGDSTVSSVRSSVPIGACIRLVSRHA